MAAFKPDQARRHFATALVLVGDFERVVSGRKDRRRTRPLRVQSWASAGDPALSLSSQATARTSIVGHDARPYNAIYRSSAEPTLPSAPGSTGTTPLDFAARSATS